MAPSNFNRFDVLMEVQVNDELIIVKENLNVVELLQCLQMKDNGIAVAINSEVVSRNEWLKTSVKENDKLMIITATQGG